MAYPVHVAIANDVRMPSLGLSIHFFFVNLVRPWGPMGHSAVSGDIPGVWKSIA